eukprot:7633576-Ditylum_brightwellii.AAC.1
MAEEGVDLAIGAYKSAFLAGIVASYVFQIKEECFKDSRYRCIYRDNGLVSMVGKRMKKYIQDWLMEYQQLVNGMSGSNYLQFTTEFWHPSKEDKVGLPRKKEKKGDNIMVIYETTFNFLDMEMLWDQNSREMKFQVFRKLNHALKHIDRAITHCPIIFKSFANGVLMVLARLTSNTTVNRN